MELSAGVQKKVTKSVPGTGKQVMGKTASVAREPAPGWVEEDRLSRIALAAYYRAEARGYAPGHEMQDWLDAETEIDAGKEKVK